MQSIGERLEEARKRKGISIREAAEATKIRSDYLHKFESNQFDIKLPEIYVRGFLRTYANYLKTPADKIISDYNALGLGEAKNSRGLNREVYGRMDLSVSSAKAEKDANDTTPPVEVAAPPESSNTRNPATFIPKAAAGLPIDRALLVKAGMLVAGVIVVVVILIYLISSRGEKTTATSAVPPSTETWVRPVGGERALTLIAVDRVQVTVTQNSPRQILFQGTLPRGDRREVPYKAALTIDTDIPENLRINVGGPTDYELRDPNTKAFVRSAPINPPPR